ncbi:hypothetical protein [Promicromonospora sp. NPDC023805]|uniref:hypothetical protein n=1 Tax=Promicromonospora sp. NPDC023805 TaxID=3154696 RepID=UPI0033C231B7
MFGLSGMILPAAVVVLVLVPGAVALLVAVLLAGRPEGHDATVAAARRHEARISAAAAALSIGLAVGLSSRAVDPWGPPGVLLGLAPFAAVLMICLARIVGESRWPRPAGEVRTAPLVRRSVPDQGGWRLVTFLGTTGALGVAFVVFGLTAAADGRSVEGVERQVTYPGDPGTEVVSAAGPYPGWEFGGPALVLLVLVVVAVLVALRVVTRRPPIGLLSPAQDDAIRRTSASRVLAGAQLWVGLGAAGHLAFAGGALNSTGGMTGGLVSLVLALVLVIGSVVIAAPALLYRRVEAAGTAPRAASTGSPA